MAHVGSRVTEKNHQITLSTHPQHEVYVDQDDRQT